MGEGGHWEAKKCSDLFKSIRDEFVQGLEAAIAENLPEYAGVTNQHLREMVQIAQSGDWSDPEIIRALSKRFSEIRQEPYKDYFRDKEDYVNLLRAHKGDSK